MSPITQQKANLRSSQVREKNLRLDSLNVSGFRCFNELTVNRLEKVNLFVGKNSCGKTALLESLYIYGNNGSQDSIIDVLISRGELDSVPNLQNERGAFQSWGLENLFRNWPDPFELSRSRKYQVVASVSSISDPSNAVSIGFVQKEAGTPFISHIHGHNLRKIPVHFSRLERIGEKKIQHLWNAIEMTIYEDFITNALRILIDDLVSVRLLEHKEWNGVKIPLARLESHKSPIQLQSIGFGAYRLFEILLLAVNCQNGILLIDEIDSGIHHNAFKAIWSSLFELSSKLNIQIFVTGSGKALNENFLNSGDSSTNKAVFYLEKSRDEVVVAKSEKRLATENAS